MKGREPGQPSLVFCSTNCQNLTKRELSFSKRPFVFSKQTQHEALLRQTRAKLYITDLSSLPTEKPCNEMQLVKRVNKTKGFVFLIFSLCLFGGWGCHGAHMEARGKLAESSLPPPCGSQALNSNCQAWWQTPLSTKSSNSHKRRLLRIGAFVVAVLLLHLK